MKYFEFLPTIKYTFSDGEYTTVDLFTRIGFNENFFNSEILKYEDRLDRPYSPENLSDLKYQTYDYYWILMLANKVYDVNKDWIVSQQQFSNELDIQRKKPVFYIYENAEIAPNDILYLDESSYGVIESWNPFYKEIVLKENHGLSTSGWSTKKFKIKRIYKDGSTVDLPNYCSTNKTDFTIFGYKPYLESPDVIEGGSGIVLNPFSVVTSGNVTSDLVLDTCDASDKTAFQTTLIYKLVNNETVNGVSITTKELKMTRDFAKRNTVNIVNGVYAPLIEDKAKLLINDASTKTNTMFRIG